MRTRLQRDSADTNEAGWPTQQQPGTQPGPEGVRARADALQKEIDALDRRIAANRAAMAARRGLSEPVEGELRTARTVRDAATARLNDVRAAAGMRGERLRVIDPGIVPQRPTFPNVPLNVFAALFVALVVSVGVLTVSFAFHQRDRPAPVRAAYR